MLQVRRAGKDAPNSLRFRRRVHHSQMPCESTVAFLLNATLAGNSAFAPLKGHLWRQKLPSQKLAISNRSRNLIG